MISLSNRDKAMTQLKKGGHLADATADASCVSRSSRRRAATNCAGMLKDTCEAQVPDNDWGGDIDEDGAHPGCQWKAAMVQSELSVEESDGAAMVQAEIVACTMVRNEFAYLPEWILFHHAMGVQKFVIYDDRSTDGVQALSELFRPQNITVEVLWTGTAGGGQPRAFTHCLQQHRNASWVGVFDVDEFVVVKGDCAGDTNPLRCLFAGLDPSIQQLRFPELRFGSAGQLHDFDIRLGSSLTFTYDEGTEFSQGIPDIRRRILEQIDNIPPEDLRRPIDCSELQPTPPGRHYTDGLPCLHVGDEGTLPSLTRSQLWRHPIPGTKEDDEAKAAETVCRGWGLCDKRPGKSFVRPSSCPSYHVHDCWGGKDDPVLVEHTLSFAVAQLNHYFVRSQDNACVHAMNWNNTKPVLIYATVDATYLNMEKDDVASEVLPQFAQQLAALACE